MNNSEKYSKHLLEYLQSLKNISQSSAFGFPKD